MPFVQVEIVFVTNSQALRFFLSLITAVFVSIFTQCEDKKNRGVLPYKRLTGMCRWVGSHFHDWIDNNGVAFSIELLEWCRKFSDFWGKTVLHIYG